MDHVLAPEALAQGFRLTVQDVVGSTNAEAMDRLRAGEVAPHWFVAREQSAGRGRRGSAWSTPRGNLAASLLWPLRGVPAPVAPLYGFVAGVALAAALRGIAGSGLGLGLKWPNDVLVDGGKLAGILLERDGATPDAIVIGFGVNVAVAPQGLPYRATSLAEQGIVTGPEALFAALSTAMAAALDLFAEGAGFARIRQAWLADAAGLGGPVSVRSGGTVLQGRFETIDETGRLVLRTLEGEPRTVTAGDVHFGPIATAA